jgi:hypothetical protein
MDPAETFPIEMSIKRPSRLQTTLQLAQPTLKRAQKAFRASISTIEPARPNPDSPQAPVPLPKALVSALKKTSQAVSKVRVTEGCLLAGIILLAGLLASCLIDWLVRTPQPVRVLLFLLQMLLVSGIVWLRVIRPLAHQPSDRESALLLQKKFPRLQSALISALELSCGHGRSQPGARGLVERHCRESAALLQGIKPAAVASPNSIQKLSRIAGSILIANVLWIILLLPGSLSWLARWPGFPVPPPTQTIVRDITAGLTAPRGSNVELLARAEGVLPKAGLVSLKFADGTTASVPAQPVPDRKGEFSALVTSVQTPFQYTFQLNDGEGTPHQVQVVLAPAVAKFSIQETFPAYTKLPPKEHATGNMIFLVGSTLKINLAATQDLRTAGITLVGADQNIPLEISETSPSSASVTLKVPPGITGVSFPLIDTKGIASFADTIFRAGSIEDKPPTLRLLGASSSVSTLTPTADNDIIHSCTDDFGISRLTLHYALAPTRGETVPPESEFKQLPVPVPTTEQAIFNWKPGSLPGAAPGQTVHFFLEAADNRAPDGPGITRTETRSLNIISLAEKRLETLLRAAEAAKQIHDLSDQQLDVQDQLKTNPELKKP